MLDIKSNKVIVATYSLIILLIIGNLIADFKVQDAVYIIAFIIYFIRYKLQKNEDYTI